MSSQNSIKYMSHGGTQVISCALAFLYCKVHGLIPKCVLWSCRNIPLRNVCLLNLDSALIHGQFLELGRGSFGKVCSASLLGRGAAPPQPIALKEPLETVSNQVCLRVSVLDVVP
jgi:hypothetical protein